MTAIFIRLKGLLVFGILLLSISIIWIGLSRAIPRNLDLPTVAPTEQVPKVAPNSADSTVTIVAQDEEKKRKDSFFGEYRLERERTRSERVEILREIVKNDNSSAEMRKEAQQKLLKITDDLEKESKIENTLIAKGFVDSIAVIEAEAVMVIVPPENLEQDEINRIADLVVRVTGCKMEEVLIVPIR